MKKIDEQDLKNLAQSVAFRLQNFPEAGNTVLLFGEMGTGKTTFARFFGEFFGKTEISSPTFSIVEKHILSHAKTLIHADFHRIGTERTMDILEDIFDDIEEKIFLLEWIPKESEKEFFQNIAHIKIFLEHGENASHRYMKWETVNPKKISVNHAYCLLDEWKTPIHVRNHIEKVRQVAIFCAQKLQENGIVIDIEMVESAAILHDCVRYVDFPTFEEKDFVHYKEDITQEKLNFWKKVKNDFLHIHHADAMSKILQEKGFLAEAKVVAFHKTGSIFQKNEPSWEEICVYYADKRALHDTIVSLEERLEDGRKRYAHEKSPGLSEKIFALEKKLCEAGKFSPEEIF